MIRAYLFALDPTGAQVEAMRSHCGAARKAYNWCLAQVRANWEQRRAEESYGIPEHQRTPWINTSAYSLRKAWNAAKNQVAPWWAENSKEAYATGCANLATALGNRRAGRTRMPRFKAKHRSRPSCRFTTGSFGLVRDRRHVQLPVIGVVRTAESTRKLARKVDTGDARIRSATLSYQRGRWHVAFTVELPEVEPAPRDGGRVLGRVVGVDLGIATLATLCTSPGCCATADSPVASAMWAGRRSAASSPTTFVCPACGIVLDRDDNAARNLAALAAADTGESRREQPDRTDTRPAQHAAVAAGPLREESCGTQRHHREVVAADHRRPTHAS